MQDASSITEASPSPGSIWLGLLLCWGMNFVQVWVAGTIAWAVSEGPGGSDTMVSIAFAIAFSVGLLQLFYVIPLWRALKTNGKTQTIKGVVIAACVTALLNAAWLVFKAVQ
jgi:hypothetical protein